MKDNIKTQKQLLNEISNLQTKIEELKKVEHKHIEIQEELQASNQQLIATEQQLRSTNMELYKSENRYRTFVENASDAFYLSDLQGNLLDVNDAACTALGYTREELLKMNISNIDINFPTDKLTEILGSLEFNKAQQVESKHKKKNGKIFPVEVIIRSFGSKENPLLLSLARDVTERKHSEQQLKTSEEKFRSLIINIPDVVWTTDIEGNTNFISENVEEIYGFTREEIYRNGSKLFLDRIHPEEKETVENAFSNLFLKGKRFDIEYRIKRKDGEWIWLQDRALKVYEESGIKYADGIFTDITKRKNSEQQLMTANQQLDASNQQLSANEQQLRAANQQLEANNQQLIASEHELKKEKNYTEKIVETASAIIVGLDKDHIIRIFNKGAEQITGYAKEEVIGKDWFKIFFPSEMLEEMNKVWKDAWGISSHSYVNPILSKTGKEIMVSWQSTGIYDDDDISKHLLLSIGEDITERIRAEEELKESEEKFKALYENAPLSYQSLDTDGCFRDVNPTWLTTLGYKREEVIGKCFAEFLHPDWKPHFETNFPAFKKRGYVHDVQFKIRHKEGNYLDISFEGCVGYFPDGNFKQTYCVFQDITERKKAEEALKESEDKYRNLVERANDGICIIQDGLIKFINPILVDLWGGSIEDILETPLTNYVHPDEQSKLIDYYTRRIKGEDVPPIYESALLQKNGEKVSVELSAGIISYNGKPADMIMVRDITERKKAEEDIISRNKELELFNKIAVGRELAMINLKKEVNKLLEEAGKKPAYEIVE